MTLIEKVLNLRTWQANWNGYEVDPPDQEAITTALFVVQDLLKDCPEICEQPYIVALEGDGSVSLEFWGNDDRKISIFIEREKTEWLKSWGPRMFLDMEDGTITKREQLKELYGWMVDPIWKKPEDTP